MEYDDKDAAEQAQDGTLLTHPSLEASTTPAQEHPKMGEGLGRDQGRATVELVLADGEGSAPSPDDGGEKCQSNHTPDKSVGGAPQVGDPLGEE